MSESTFFNKEFLKICQSPQFLIGNLSNFFRVANGLGKSGFKVFSTKRQKSSMDLSGYFFWFDFCYSKNTSVRVIRFKCFSVIGPCLRQSFFGRLLFSPVFWSKLLVFYCFLASLAPVFCPNLLFFLLFSPVF